MAFINRDDQCSINKKLCKKSTRPKTLLIESRVLVSDDSSIVLPEAHLELVFQNVRDGSERRCFGIRSLLFKELLQFLTFDVSRTMLNQVLTYNELSLDVILWLCRMLIEVLRFAFI